MSFLNRHVRSLRLFGCVLALGLVNACMEELVQTAIAGPDDSSSQSGGQGGQPAQVDELECETPAGSGELPQGGGTGVEESPFLAGSYGVTQGPGLAVAARDTFRVYVNGQVVAESNAARVPVFLPLTLAPGDNVIALTVAADTGTPAVLVQLDELDRSYVSSRDWKLSTAPSGDWQTAGYDDSKWEDAHELAEFGDLPGCDPEDDFPQSSTARWIGPELGTEGQIALRLTVRIAPTGFGAAATGGMGAEPVLVSTWDELEAAVDTGKKALILLPEGVHDFRRKGADIQDVDVCPTPCPNDSSKTLHQVLIGEATCADPLVTLQRDDRILTLNSNTTIVGLGRGAAIRGVSFDFQSSENLVVRNVALYDINPTIIEAGDAFSLYQPKRVWIDHATVKWVSDGFTDVLAGSSEITLSYVHYDGENDAACDGQHLSTSQIIDSEVTVHHSRYDHASTHAPLVVGHLSRAHLFNNVFTNIDGWAAGTACAATVLLEGSMFENVAAATNYLSCPDDLGKGYLDLPAGSNLYRDESATFLGGDGAEPHDAGFSPPYEYQVELANEAWPVVLSRAGAGGPWALPLVRD